MAKGYTTRFYLDEKRVPKKTIDCFNENNRITALIYMCFAFCAIEVSQKFLLPNGQTLKIIVNRKEDKK